MKAYTKSIEALINQLVKMPGIGSRSAERLVFHILKLSPGQVEQLASAISRLKNSVGCCSICYNLSEEKICQVCRDASRDKSVICVVGQPHDVLAIEKSGEFLGVYHVLLGAISPLDGVGPEKLKIAELIHRVKKGGVKEVIIASDYDTEGETTALYLVKVLKPLGVKLSRIASGIPLGGNIEYADQATLARALKDRKET